MKRRVYAISDYPEEVVAVAFAKTSRSPEAFDEILKGLSDESSSKFHDKWVVGYGHSSVAEHAVLHLAVENASRLAIETLQSCRLASYTEKSSRYQVMDKEHVVKPKELEGELETEYTNTVEALFTSYSKVLDGMTKYFSEKEEKKEGDKFFENRMKLKALDNARFILPNATMANVGITVNARELEHMIIKMLSHPLEEVREIGEEMKTESTKVTPTLLKKANQSEYLTETEKTLETEFKSLKSETEKDVRLLDYEKDAVDKLVSAIVFRFSQSDYNSIKEKVGKMPQEEKVKILDDAFGKLKWFDIPLREMEHINYTFDLTMDHGAFYDFKRHRMCTMSVQPPTVHNGYVIPEDVVSAGFGDEFDNAMKASEKCYNIIAEKHPHVAGYISTNAHKRRVLATMNMRELYHFIKLRTRPNVHFTVRKVAFGMLEELNKVHPEIVKYMGV